MSECLGEFLLGGAQEEELAGCGCGLLHEHQALCETKQRELSRVGEEEEEGPRRGDGQKTSDVREEGAEK